MILTPKNWKSFQHYKERSPSWVKLHKGLLTDFEFVRLPVASRALAPMLWLLASEYEGGAISASLEKIAFRVHMPVEELQAALSPLIESGFFDASEVLAEPKQKAIPEKRDIDNRNIEQKNTEANASGAEAPPDPSIPEREYFLRGREVLGQGAGGLIAKLLKAKGGNVALARAAIEQASQKHDATEYIGGICRGPPVSSKPLTEFQRKQAETNEVRAQLRAFAASGRSGGEADRGLPFDHSERSKNLRDGDGSALLTISGASDRGGG